MRRRRRTRGGWWKTLVGGWLLVAVIAGIAGAHQGHGVPQRGPSWYQVEGTMQGGGQGAAVAQPASPGHAAARLHVRVPYRLRPRVFRYRRPWWRRWWMRRVRRGLGY